MAKFIMEDGSIKSGDQIYDEMMYEGEINEMRNSNRLINMWIGDVLRKISDTLNTREGYDPDIDKKCVLDLITGKKHNCLIKTDVDEKGNKHRHKDCHMCINNWMNSDKW